MDLQISAFLLFLLFTAGHSLSCYECSGLLGSCASQSLKTCPSGPSKCMSLTTVVNVGGSGTKVKVKECAADCVSGSMNIGVGKTSFACCNTDGCNVNDATGTFGGQSTVVKGCVSKSICDAGSSVRDVQGASCCSGNLCNGVQSVSQSFLFLCCSLLSFILLH